MDRARVIVDKPASGSWNMAVDQALLELSNRFGQITLRFYYWSTPTVSLGYFQPAESRNSHAESLRCDWVRRATGGGAIVHDHELTYSLCIPSTHQWASDNQTIYSNVHRCLLSVLGGLGVAGVLCETPAQPATQPFLCFQRRAIGDVLLGRHKVCGSAQRRIKNALLQHGSILVSESECAPQLPGINQLSPVKLESEKLVELLTEEIGRQLKLDLRSGAMSNREHDYSIQIESEKFGAHHWNHRR